MKVHPVAELFPMMSDDELADLAADIKANGLIHPIITAMIDGEETLIDGRNRYKACEIAGVIPRLADLNGGDPTAFILSTNVARRQMTKGALAMVVAKAYPKSDERGRGKKSAATAHFPMVKPRRLEEARTVLRYAGELADAVIAGTTSLDQAYEIAGERKQAAQSDAARMITLRAGAADLADQVNEERLSLSEAFAAFEQRQRDASEREKSLRETLIRSVEASLSVLAWANDEFVADVQARLSDPEFRDTLIRRSRIDARPIAEIERGAAALARVLTNLGE